MQWLYLVIILGAVAYFGYMRYKDKLRRKVAQAPKCETCGTHMELQIKSGDSEIWVCGKCNPDDE